MEQSADWDAWTRARMCATCGWIPIEGMGTYLSIHGAEATCLRCGGHLPSEQYQLPPDGGEGEDDLEYERRQAG